MIDAEASKPLDATTKTSAADYLNDYCERSGNAGVWAEPLNAVSNFAFIVAAFFSAMVMRRQGMCCLRRYGDLIVLVVSLFAIGVGSFLWHSYASPTTVMMDVIPILIFMNVYLLSAARRVLRFPWWAVAVFWLAFQGLNATSQAFFPADTLHGSLMYIPAYMVLLFIGAVSYKRAPELAKGYLSVIILFTASLSFRTVDLEVCHALPIGTHFVWHLLNSVVLYRLLALLIDRSADRP